MRSSLINSIDKYIKACKNSSWVLDEAYKFEFANYINQNVKWESQTDLNILEILIKSQNNKYTRSDRGIQFILKSGREKLSEFITVRDVELIRQIKHGIDFEKIDWTNRGMSYTGLSAWLASLFPEDFYPVPFVGINETINFLFDTNLEKFPKTGKKYLLSCQPYMAETEEILKQYPIEDLCLNKWNVFYDSNPQLNINPKTSLSKVDWVWLAQDFHLFVHRSILNLYKKKSKKIKIQDDDEPIVVEGKSSLAIHMRYERNNSLIKKIKKDALAENKMLNCEVCGFSFLENYGEIGEGFIEAHHINPLSERNGISFTKRSDIALVCSNCHRMLHKGDPVYQIDELKVRMNGK